MFMKVALVLCCVLHIRRKYEAGAMQQNAVGEGTCIPAQKTKLWAYIDISNPKTEKRNNDYSMFHIIYLRDGRRKKASEFCLRKNNT